MAEAKKVTRIKATDDAPKNTKSVKPTASKEAKVVKARKTSSKPAASQPTTENKNVFARIGGYFKGAWVELRQVRWPNRKATWALTLAVIVFSLFFLGFIVLLDLFFKWLFEIIIA